MKVAKTHANWLIGLKATARGDHFNPWWLKWVFFRKLESAMIVASLVRTVLEAKDAEMPKKDVV